MKTSTAKYTPDANKGTPKTLSSAIINGLDDAEFEENVRPAWIVEAHIKEFIKNRLSAMMISSDDLEVKYAEKIQKLLGL